MAPLCLAASGHAQTGTHFERIMQVAPLSTHHVQWRQLPSKMFVVCSEMLESFTSDDAAATRAAEIERTFGVSDGLYLVGGMERGVTLYNQQVRAHNLVWALWELDRHGRRKIGRIAVIGGGAAGLTITAGLLARYGGAVRITLFERLWDLCPLQQGSDARWLHPRIYEWPSTGSRSPGASLPILNWSEGRASDVANTLVKRFGEYCQEFSLEQESLTVFIGLRNFQMRTEPLTIDWVGTRAERIGPFFRRGNSEGNSAAFDTVIVAAGFGLERLSSPYQTSSYWRNEQIAQPILDGGPRSYVVSGYGDGALVDLCRLTIERFRQDTIVYELFGACLEAVEDKINADLRTADASANLFPYFRSIEGELLTEALSQLAARIRKDTAVVLHIRGREGSITSFAEIFGPTSSRLNRLLVYLLHRCGAFSTSVEALDECVRSHRVSPEAVLCRHGSDTREHLRSIIADCDKIEKRLDEMRREQAQTPFRVWRPGAFPTTKQGNQR